MENHHLSELVGGLVRGKQTTRTIVPLEGLKLAELVIVQAG